MDKICIHFENFLKIVEKLMKTITKISLRNTFRLNKWVDQAVKK